MLQETLSKEIRIPEEKTITRSEMIKTIDVLEKKVISYLQSSALHGVNIHPSELHRLFIQEKIKYSNYSIM
jgi:hypothetical protein